MGSQAAPELAEVVDSVSLTAFGHHFVDLAPEFAENLITLEREGAIYSYFAIDGTEQPDGTAEFAYYRIPFELREIVLYVEATVAYQQFHETLASLGAPSEFSREEWLELGLTAITDPDIRQRVREYGDYGKSRLRDGSTYDNRGCHASFYADGLEDLLCGGRKDRYEALPDLGSRETLGLVMRVINSLPVAARALAHRQRSRPPFAIENEYDVQDLLFAVLRCTFSDIRCEEWTPRRAGSAKRMDFLLEDSGIAIETKFVRDQAHAKAVADELRIDIDCYGEHERCEHLVALVWDPEQHLLDPEQFASDLSGMRQRNGRTFDVTVVVR
jgi:hypothetical protein